MKKLNKKDKIKFFLCSPWIVGVAFYLLGLLTPQTITFVKEYSLIKQEVNNIDVVGNMIIDQSSKNFSFFYFSSFVIILIFLIFIIIHNIEED